MKKIIAIAGLLLAGALVAGVWWARPHYRHYKEQREVKRMQAFLAKGDAAKARMSARLILFFNSNNVPALLAMADMADRARSPYTLVWRQKALDVKPSSEQRLRLAEDALQYEAPPYPVAAKALQSLPELDRQTVEYHLAAARLATRLQQTGVAELHFEAALKIEPVNPLHRLNLAVLHLLSTNPAVVAQARATLEEIGNRPGLGEQALRTLITERLERKDWEKVRSYSEQLLRLPQAAFSDRLTHLQALDMLKSPDLARWMAAAQQSCATNLPGIHDLTIWMIASGRTPEAMTWLQGLPPRLRNQQPVPLAMASCYAAKSDWSALDAFLRRGQWGEQEFLRLAILARALRQENEREVSAINWRKAVKAAGRPELQAVLAELARAWKWQAERMELLWTMAGEPTGRWALDTLRREYLAAGDTAALQRVALAALRFDDSNLLIKNDVAALSFLLNTNLAQAHQLAREVYREKSNQCVFASTYAFSLQLQGKTAEALAIFKRLKPEELQRPNIALYYAALLAQAGQKDSARQYLGYADTTAFLPEEKAMRERLKRAL